MLPIFSFAPQNMRADMLAVRQGAYFAIADIVCQPVQLRCLWIEAESVADPERHQPSMTGTGAVCEAATSARDALAHRPTVPDDRDQEA